MLLLVTSALTARSLRARCALAAYSQRAVYAAAPRSLLCALAALRARHELSLPRARYAPDACLLRAICALAARLPRAGALRFRGAKRHVFRIAICKSIMLRSLIMLHMLY